MAEGRPHVHRLQGEIDLANAAAVQADVIDRLGGASALVIDLTDVTYFDSSGLRMLDGLAGACRAAGLPLRVVAPEGGRPRFILRVCAWPEELVAESAEEALAALSAGGA